MTQKLNLIRYILSKVLHGKEVTPNTNHKDIKTIFKTEKRQRESDTGKGFIPAKTLN